MELYARHHLLIQGSSVARQASEKEKTKELPMYKDNDFVSEGIKIHIGATAKQRLMNILKADTDVSYFSTRGDLFEQIFGLFCKNSSVDLGMQSLCTTYVYVYSF
jgi:hypothetical protein